MWPRLLLLLGLDLGLRSLSLPLAPRSAGAIVSAPVSPAGAGAHRSPPEARPRDPPRGKAVALRSAGGARGLSWLSGRTRLSLRRRVALGRGVILGGGPGICFSHRSSRWAQRPCFHVHVLLRAPRARRATPTHADLHVSAPRGRLSLQRLVRLQRSLGPPEWTFHPGAVSPTDDSSASGLSPRSTPPGGRLPSPGFVAQTECPTDGLRPVVSEGVTSDNPQAVESSVSCLVARQDLCVIRKVEIDRSSSNFTLVFTKKMRIFVVANIVYDCPSAQFKEVDWKVFSVPLMWGQPNWSDPLPVLKFVSRQGLAVEIPKNTLPPGVYVLRVYLKLVGPTGEVLEDSDFVYLVMARSPLQAVLLGDTNIRIQFTEELVLDGSVSVDPDADDPLQDVQFSWYCTTNPTDYQGVQIDMRSRAVCLPELGSLRWEGASGTVLRLPPRTLKGSRVYFFRMVIHKRGSSAFSNKRVQVLPGPTPVAKIVCTENCSPVLVISDRFSLFVKCTNCMGGRDLYSWSILSLSGGEVVFDWAGQTSTGRNSDYLSVKAFAFRDFAEAKFSLSVLLEAWSGISVMFKYPFVINHAPKTGDCKVNPASGIAFYTEFVIQCSDFRDQNTPFTYKMIVSDLHGFGEISSLKENTLGPILYLGPAPTSPRSFLPVGEQLSHHAVKILVQVYDSLGAFSQVTVYATVQAPTDAYAPQTVMQRLLNYTTGPGSVLFTLLRGQGFLPAGYLMYIAASVLNSMRTEASLRADKEGLREHLLNVSFTLPVGTLVEVGQLITAVARLTQKTSECTSVTKKNATARIWQATQALREHQRNNKNFHAEQIETVSTGILTSLSHVLKMTTRYEVFTDPFYVMQSLADTVLVGMVPGNDTVSMKTSNFNVYIRKTEKWLATYVLGDEEHGRNWLRATLNESSAPGLSTNAPISATFCEFADHPFPWMDDQDSLSADVVGFRMTGGTAAGDVLELTPEVVDVYLGRRNLSSAAFNLTVGPDDEPGAGDEASRKTTGAFRFTLDSGDTKELLVHIVTEVTVLFTVSVYAGNRVSPEALVATFLVPHDIPPVANHSGLFDPTCAVKMARVVCLPPSLLQAAAQRGRSPEGSVVVAVQAAHFVTEPTDKLVRVSLFSAYCLDMLGIQSDWREDACVLGEKTVWDRVHCICRAARRARRQLDAGNLANVRLHFRYFTAKVLVVPNPVDLRLEVIKSISRNPVALFTVLFIVCVYVALAFWALHRDEIDKFLRDHVIVLPDNDPYDDVCYLVTIFTGSRCGAGTRADVFVQLRGTVGASDVHCLSHPHFKALYRGSINTFLLTTRSDLGDIRNIRVWHNNEGRAPSWYLSRIKVENLFSRHIWLFMCRAWLSIDTSVDRTFEVADPNVPLKRVDFCLIDMTKEAEKAHMWFSVFTGIVSKGFSRLERLSCCLAMLLASLLCNIMFFNLNEEEEEGAGPQGGHYLRSMVIGLESAVITLPVQVAITGLFTCSHRQPQVSLEEVSPRKPPVTAAGAGHWEDRLKKWHARETEEQPPSPGSSRGLGKSSGEATSKVRRPWKKAEGKASLQPRTNANNSNKNVNDNNKNVNDNNKNVNNSNKNVNDGPGVPAEQPPSPEDSPPPATKPRVELPGWCVFVAWCLVFATSGVSSFFIVLYGLTYGYERSIEWLFASFCSFCQSIFLVQPLKIIFLSGLRSNRPKYCKNLSWVSNYRYTEIQLQDPRRDPAKMRERHQRVVELRGTRMYQPLTEDEIGIFKRKKRAKRGAWLLLASTLTHFILLALLLGLAALLRRADSFYYNRFIRRQFSEGLATVTKLDDVYLWLSSVTLPLFHNDGNPTFLPDSSSQILGLPLMRQVRAKPAEKACLPAHSPVPDSLKREIHCHPAYGTHPEDTANYTQFWKKVNKRTTDKNTQGFTYKPPERRWVYYSYGLLHTYGSGGYAFYFFPDQQQFNSTLRLKDLQSSHWLDEKTWAVILDLTTFNPDVSLVCSVSVVFEVSPYGVVNASVSVYSFSPGSFGGKPSAELALYAAILVCFLAHVAHVVYTVWQERASCVTRAGNWLSLALSCAFAALIVLLLSKHFLAAGVLRSYSSNSRDFVPFHAVSQADHAMRIALGFLLFLAILKTLRYCRFFYSVRLAQRAMHTALPAIFHVALMLSLCFFVYVALGCLVFGQHEWNYSRLLHATQTVLSYCVSAFQNIDFSQNRVLGALFLSSFILLVICLLINLFRATVLSAHEEMAQPVYEAPSDEAEAVAYLCGKLRRLLGFLSLRPKAPDKPTCFMDMLYGRPERQNRRFLGLKTRNMNERKVVYLVM
ncbi:polycystic kidney disease and receptor for egg jelly-related protein [Phyllostomus hastatus]|uniref:polycystic kidney disease and receptor for egg jelly-related protein n=1 Tax=Phyllostomus hastatus TaxID=9423 RepID=UPI001E67E6E6|nr:polycystic kidney disease and receptor for egg jelly-related protein [Phyllostomus hastatus]